MTRVLRSVPAALAALLLAAHFYRGGMLAMVVACLLGTFLAFVRRPLPTLLVRAGLATGVIVWTHTAWRIAQERIADGRPHLRMLMILGAVAVFTALAAWLLPRSEPARSEGDAS